MAVTRHARVICHLQDIKPLGTQEADLLRHDPSGRLPFPVRFAAPPVSEDAPLVSLLRRWVELSDLNAKQCDRQDDLWAAAFDVLPVPMELRADKANPASTICRFKSVELRDSLVAMINNPMISDEPSFNDGLVRVNQELAALDAYQAQLAAERERNGHAAAYAEYIQSGHAMTAVEVEIANTPAAGFAGMLVKLTLANQWMGFITEDDEGEDQDNRLIKSVARDLERLSGVTIAQLLGQ